MAPAAFATAASITNTDTDPAMLAVTEGSVRLDIVIDPGNTQDLCPSGCFITFPDGDRMALGGSETIEIVKGSAVLK